MTRSDLLVINKIDLAPYVGASLEVMARDAAAMRKGRPFVMANMKTGAGLDAIVDFLHAKGGLGALRPRRRRRRLSELPRRRHNRATPGTGAAARVDSVNTAR